MPLYAELKAKSPLIKTANCCLMCRHSYIAHTRQPTPACHIHHCEVDSSDWCKHFKTKFNGAGDVQRD